MSDDTARERAALVRALHTAAKDDCIAHGYHDGPLWLQRVFISAHAKGAGQVARKRFDVQRSIRNAQLAKNPPAAGCHMRGFFAGWERNGGPALATEDGALILRLQPHLDDSRKVRVSYGRPGEKLSVVDGVIRRPVLHGRPLESWLSTYVIDMIGTMGEEPGNRLTHLLGFLWHWSSLKGDA